VITFRYINKNEQPDSVSFTLLIEDEDKDEFVDVIRIEKVFKCDSECIDEEFLRAEAKREIVKILSEIANPVEVPPLDLPIEIPEE
jgi:hypothetical protein